MIFVKKEEKKESAKSDIAAVSIVALLLGGLTVGAGFLINNSIKTRPEVFAENIVETTKNINEAKEFKTWEYNNGYENNSLVLTGVGCKLISPKNAQFDIIGKVKNSDFFDTVSLGYVVTYKDLKMFLGCSDSNTEVNLQDIKNPNGNLVSLSNMMSIISSKCKIDTIDVHEDLRVNVENDSFLNSDIKNIYANEKYIDLTDENLVFDYDENSNFIFEAEDELVC